jgi:hypothetical protein
MTRSCHLTRRAVASGAGAFQKSGCQKSSRKSAADKDRRISTSKFFNVADHCANVVALEISGDLFDLLS